MSNANELAFPLVVTNLNGDSQVSTGLTKRELFAAMAMQGWRAGGDLRDSDDIAKLAKEDADALLAEFEKS